MAGTKGQTKVAIPAFQSSPKLDKSLARVRLDEGARIRVIIYLADQPFEAIRSSLEQQSAVRLAAAERARTEAFLKRDPRAYSSAQRQFDDEIMDYRRNLLGALGASQRASQDELERGLRALGATDVSRFRAINMVRAEVPSGALSALEADPRIAEIGLDSENEAHLNVSTSSMGAPSLWDAGFTGSGLSVLVLDSGVTAAHPAFGGRIRTGSFVSSSLSCSAAERASAADFNGHGTHVAGIIASAGTTLFPSLRGVAYGISTLYSGKVSCENGRSFTGDILAAVEAALESTPIEIANNSNGSPTDLDDDFHSRRIDELVDRYNLVWVNSAGNSGPAARSVTSPGIAYNAISVAAMDTRGTTDRSGAVVASFSSRGPTAGGRFKPDLAAPGADIFSTHHDTAGFVANSGTSMAAPHVAGAAVLLRQAGVPGRLSVKALLVNTTDTGGWSPGLGWGYVNLRRALEQRNLLQGSLSSSSGTFVLYRGIIQSTRDLFATLAWNRYVRGGSQFLRDLDFAIYRQGDGQLLDRSEEVRQNVEQVSAARTATPTPVILKVLGFNDGAGFTEPFTVALSEPGFQVARGPAFNISCVGLTTIAVQATGTYTCTVRNDGDVPAFRVSVQAGFASWPLASSAVLPVLLPGASTSPSFTLTAPAVPGETTLRVVVQSTAYEEDFPEVANFVVTVRSAGGTAPPRIDSGGVVNGASFRPGFASAQWVTIRGVNLSQVTRTLQFVNGSYPTQSDGVSVTMNGRAAALFYLSPTQLNVISPDLIGSGPIQIVVTTGGAASEPFIGQLQNFSPAFFLWPGGYAVATDPNFQFKVRSGTFAGLGTTPARPDDVIILWATGLGPTNPFVSAGRQVPADRLYAVSVPVRVTVGSIQAEVFGAALAPGFASLYQIAIRVPNLSNGDFTVVAEVGGVASPAALLTVQR